MQPPAAAATARSELRPASGPPGTPVVVTARGFGPRRGIAVRDGRRVLARTRTTRAGDARLTFTPRGAGRTARLLVGGSSGSRTTHVFRYADAQAPAAGEVARAGGERLRWSPARVHRGGRLRVRGAGFGRRRAVVVATGSSVLGRARSRRSGGFTTRLEVPVVAPGARTVTVRAAGLRMAFRLRVLPDPIAVAAGDIACDPASDSFNGGEGRSGSCRMRATSDVALAAGPQAVLALGDLQYEDGALERFQASYHPTWGRLLEVTYPAPGNHEYLTPGAAGYFAYFGARAGDPARGWYSFDIGTWHLIALNSNCSRVGGCGPGSPQETWLRTDLARHRTRCTLAFWHHPRFSSGRHGSFAAMQPIVQALHDARADVMLAGHDHLYERFAPLAPDGRPDPHGVRSFVVGTGGRNITRFATPATGSEVRDDGTFGVLELTLGPGRYAWMFRPALGAAFTDAGRDVCR